MTLGRLRLYAGHAVIALLVAVSAGAAAAPSEDARLGQFIPQDPPQPAPAVAFTDIAGNAVSLADFKGTVTLVNLWATWCRPCLEEMPSLERLQTRLGGALKVAAISEDLGGAKTVEPFVARHGIGGLAIYLDPKGAAIRAFRVQGLPTSVLLDREGRIVGRVEGSADWGSAKLRALFRSLVPAKTHETAAKSALSRS